MISPIPVRILHGKKVAFVNHVGQFDIYCGNVFLEDLMSYVLFPVGLELPDDVPMAAMSELDDAIEEAKKISPELNLDLLREEPIVRGGIRIERRYRSEKHTIEYLVFDPRFPPKLIPSHYNLMWYGRTYAWFQNLDEAIDFADKFQERFHGFVLDTGAVRVKDRIVSFTKEEVDRFRSRFCFYWIFDRDLKNQSTSLPCTEWGGSYPFCFSALRYYLYYKYGSYDAPEVMALTCKFLGIDKETYLRWQRDMIEDAER